MPQQRGGGPPRQLAQIQTQTPEPETAPNVTVTSPDGGGDKKVRSLLKKIRAIDDLKMRQAGGEKLEDTQVKKIGTEESIRRELESLGYQH
jgi:translation initiation factor 2A